MEHLWLVSYGLIIVFLGLVIYFYLVIAPKRYIQLIQYSEERLWPPGWQFLAFLPLLGQRWSGLIKQHTQSSVVLTRPYKLRKNQPDLPGRITRYVLLEEQRTIKRSEQYGVRLMPLYSREYKLVTPILGDVLQKDEILIQLSRPVREKINWGKLKLEGECLKFQNTRKSNVVPVFRYARVLESNEKLVDILRIGSATSLNTGNRLLDSTLLSSGDRFLLGLSEFQFIVLPYCQLRWFDLKQPEQHGNWILNKPRIEVWKKDDDNLTTMENQGNHLFDLTEDLQLTFFNPGFFSVTRVWSEVPSPSSTVKANQRAILQPGEYFEYEGYGFTIDYLMDGNDD